MHNETIIRIVFFFGIFGLVATWEWLAPCRALIYSKKLRWISNLTITFFNSLFVRLLLPVLAVNIAFLAQTRGWGLLNNFQISFLKQVVMGVIILDLTIYFQHVIFHAIPLLWRLHMVHHADLDYDLTTGLRFHPIEVILSMGLKIAVVVALGPPVVSVLIFEVLLNGMAMFNHGNIKIKTTVDKWLRLFVVTPDMHRVHHSVIIRETNSNYGFNLSVWDRIFGTYCDQPRKGHGNMTIGLSQFRDPKKLTLPWLLILPFISDPGKQPINRH